MLNSKSGKSPRQTHFQTEVLSYIKTNLKKERVRKLINQNDGRFLNEVSWFEAMTAIDEAREDFFFMKGENQHSHFTTKEGVVIKTLPAYIGLAFKIWSGKVLFSHINRKRAWEESKQNKDQAYKLSKDTEFIEETNRLITKAINEMSYSIGTLLNKISNQAKTDRDWETLLICLFLQ